MIFVQRNMLVIGNRSEWADDIWRRSSTVEVDKKSWKSIFPYLEGTFTIYSEKKRGFQMFSASFLSLSRQKLVGAKHTDVALRLYQFCKLTLEVLKNCLEKTAKEGICWG